MPCNSLSKLLSKNIIHSTIDNYSLKENIFKSIEKDYSGFEKWFQNISKERRKCFCIEDEDTKELVAIMIYKIEDISSGHNLYSSCNHIDKVIKISTFKVEKNRFGRKIGELFIQKIIKVALTNYIKGIYVTAYPKHIYLIQLLNKFGFYEIKRLDGELYLYKTLDKHEIKSLPLFIYQKKLISNYPFFNDNFNEVNKYIVPIRPHYHDMIFYDYPKRESSLFDNPTSIQPESNSILKAYIGKFSRDIKIGDILLFYRSQDIMQLTNLSIAVQIFNSEYKGIFYELSKYKTVFSRKELQEYIKSKNSTLVIFMPIFYLHNKVSFKKLTELSMTGNKLQTINQITDEQYRLIINEEECYKCFHANY
ncbi:hypothetical protein CRV03_05885 [Arcobacter sp. F155]|uniref:hypothetical protein n=1 Tax=Arcobacter sp. F155 TaxID=2044512 RepID=UPI00100AFA8D|nr:hypothetical protein [Arcobacter sp. F155]RXJ77214.1 hypothetical protein CRV03_05885 [Arcobacter sp. F155]